jgi:Helix-turn-helix domain
MTGKSPPPVQVWPGVVLLQGQALADMYFLASAGIREAHHNGYPVDRFKGIQRAIQDAGMSRSRHGDVADEAEEQDCDGQDDDEWIDVTAAADLLGLSRRQVQRLAKERGLGKRRGSSWTFSRSLVLAHKQFREEERHVDAV